MRQTHTTYTTSECKHNRVKIKTARVKFWLFDLAMRLEVCEDCCKLIPMQKRWKVKLN